MAKIDIGKDLAYGAGAVIVPALATEAVTKLVSSVTFLVNPLFKGISPLAVLLAAVGVGVVDYFMKQ